MSKDNPYKAQFRNHDLPKNHQGYHLPAPSTSGENETRNTQPMQQQQPQHQQPMQQQQPQHQQPQHQQPQHQQPMQQQSMQQQPQHQQPTQQQSMQQQPQHQQPMQQPQHQQPQHQQLQQNQRQQCQSSYPPPYQVVHQVDPRYFQYHRAHMAYPQQGQQGQQGVHPQQMHLQQYYRGPTHNQGASHFIQSTTSTTGMRTANNQPVFVMQRQQQMMPQFVEAYPIQSQNQQEFAQMMPNNVRVMTQNGQQPDPRQHQQLPTSYYRGPMMNVNQSRTMPTAVTQRPIPVQTATYNPNESWRTQVTDGLRNHLVKKIISTIIPDGVNPTDPRYIQLCNYAKKSEGELYNQATSKDDYYHLIAEKIHTVVKELALRRAQRSVDPSQPNENSPNGFQPKPAVSPAMNPPQSISPVNQVVFDNKNQSQVSIGCPAPISPHMQAQPTMIFDQSRNSYRLVNTPMPHVLQPIQPAQGPFVVQPTQIQQAHPSELQKLLARPPSNEMVGPANKRMKMEEPSSDGQESIKVEVDNTEALSRPASAKPTLTSPSVKTGEEKPFTLIKKERAVSSDELRAKLRPVLEKLCLHREAEPFLEPVDPIALKCPDYFKIVKKPMDFSTIFARLDAGQYRDAWDLCDDVWLIFQNCWLYNRKPTNIYKMSLKLNKEYVNEMNPVMKKMGYCCGEKLQFTFLPLLCYGTSQCIIQFNDEYMCYEKSANQMKAKFSERYTYCLECFETHVPVDGISLTDDPNDTNKIVKSEFKKLIHNQVEYEPIETCIGCSRRWHRVCALYNKKAFPKGFICPTCKEEQKIPIIENKCTAEKLPHNKLSAYLEDRVTSFLSKKTDEYGFAKHDVYIRVLYANDKTLEIRKEIKDKYSSDGFSENIPYRSKAIFAYQKIDNEEVCFFGMYVQEYGSNCGGNNQRRVYISYLDSVHFFEPRELRTEVYYEILLGYLQYVKELGYTMAHLWACPPTKGDDYIFHCHPAAQKIPNATRLRDWYCQLLEKGKGQGTVIDYKDIYEQAIEDNLTSPIQLPYFEGDLWPRIIEDCIRDARNEEKKRKIEMAKDEKEISENTKGRKRKGVKPKKKYQKTAKKMGFQTGDDVMDRIYDFLQKHKDAFFTIQFYTKSEREEMERKEIKDPDGLISSDLMEARDGFLTKARDENWEFSSLRRAKYTTMCMSYSLHNDKEAVVITCNRCDQKGARWHCRTCEDFDLCNNCKQTQPHEHPLELVALSEDEKMKRQQDTEQTMAIYVHANKCRDANCQQKGCLKMKRLLLHRRTCSKQRNSSCAPCFKFLQICCFHAKNCTNEACQVPNCASIQQRVVEILQMKTRRSDMLMRRRMDGM